MQKDSSPLRFLITRREAAKALSISERKLWSLTKAGTIRSVQIDRAVRYDVTALREFIDACQYPEL